MKKNIVKPQNLEIYSAFVWPCSGVNEIGRYRKVLPCVSLSIWCGRGYITDQFVVWDCNNTDEALERFGAWAVKTKNNDLFFTDTEITEKRATEIRDMLDNELNSIALSETSEQVVIEKLKTVDPWIAEKVTEIINNVNLIKEGLVNTSKWDTDRYFDKSQNSVIHYFENYFTDFTERETVLNYLHVAYDVIDSAEALDEEYLNEMIYIDLTHYGYGNIYIYGENFDYKVWDRGDQYVEAILNTRDAKYAA